MAGTNLKSRLLEGETVYGPFCKFLDPAIIEIAGLAGFDFVIIDMEHGPHDIAFLQNMLRAAEARNITPVVRVPENSESLILRVLDVGAEGIQVPQITTRADAEKVVRASSYYPSGNRGMCRYVRAADYSAKDRFEYFSGANTHTIRIIHLEGKEGLEKLPEILTVEGIDVIFLGPYDLSQSLGVPGEVHHEKVLNKMDEAVQLARSNHKVVGTFTESVEDARRWKSIGVQYISYRVDVGIVLDAFNNIIKEFNQ